MAKTKGSNPPFNQFSYRDADGTDHYLGEYLRSVFREGSISRYNAEEDITGSSQRGERPGQQGWGTPEQQQVRDNFLQCSSLWNSLPEYTPDELPENPITTKESVWDAKLEFGVVCSYYDLFMRCCLNWAASHNNEMPDGDCFPAIAECIEDPAMAWDTEGSAETINPSSSVDVAIVGNNSPFSWSVSGTGFTLNSEETEGLGNTLNGDADSCGSADITVTGCDERQVNMQVRSSVGKWIFIGNDCMFTEGGIYIGSATYQKTLGKYRINQYMGFSDCTGYPGKCYGSPSCPGTSGCTKWSANTCLPWECSFIASHWILCGTKCCPHNCANSSWGYCPYIDHIDNLEWVCP